MKTAPMINIVPPSSMPPIRLNQMSEVERFEEALAKMIHGVAATKYHYSKKAAKKCNVSIS